MYILISRETTQPRYLHKDDSNKYFWTIYRDDALEFGTIEGAKEMAKAHNWSAKPIKKSPSK